MMTSIAAPVTTVAMEVLPTQMQPVSRMVSTRHASWILVIQVQSCFQTVWVAVRRSTCTKAKADQAIVDGAPLHGIVETAPS